MRVKSRWQTMNGHYYNGTVTKLNSDGTYDIDYEDGDHDSNVPYARFYREAWSSDEEESEEESGDEEVLQLSKEELRKMMKMTVEEKKIRQDIVHNQWLASRLLTADKKLKKDRKAAAVVAAIMTSSETAATSVSSLGSMTTSTTSVPITSVVEATAPVTLPTLTPEARLTTATTATNNLVPEEKKKKILRVASQDVVLSEMVIPSGREYLSSASERAVSFQKHKERFREYALKRYH